MNKSILILFLAVFFAACGNKTTSQQVESQTQEKETVTTADASVVNVYYFHGKQRCRSCIAIENVTKNAIAENYKDNPKVKYTEINIDEATNKDLVEKYEIAFSSLLIVKGENSTVLTEQAFANALNSPDVLINLIKEEVNKCID